MNGEWERYYKSTISKLAFLDEIESLLIVGLSKGLARSLSGMERWSGRLVTVTFLCVFGYGARTSREKPTFLASVRPFSMWTIKICILDLGGIWNWVVLSLGLCYRWLFGPRKFHGLNLGQSSLTSFSAGLSGWAVLLLSVRWSSSFLPSGLWSVIS